MAQSLDDLITPLTKDEVREAIYAGMAAQGTNVTNWKPGAVVRVLIAAIAIVCAALSQMITALARGGYRGLATGIWATLHAKYRFGVDRDEGTFATGTLRVSNASGFSYTFDPGDIVFRNRRTKRLYRLTATFSLASNQQNVPVSVAAFERGAASTAFPDEITELETVFTGVECTNDLAIIGTDAESDAQLDAKCDAKLGSLSPFGPKDAYRWAAMQAKRPDGTAIGVTRAKAVPDTSMGVQVFYATATGPVPAADEPHVNDALNRHAAPLGITVNGSSATGAPLAIHYEVELFETNGVTNAQIIEACNAQLVNYFPNIPIGGNPSEDGQGRILLRTLEQEISRAKINDVSLPFIMAKIVEPVSDVWVFFAQVPVLDSVTCDVVRQFRRTGT